MMTFIKTKKWETRLKYAALLPLFGMLLACSTTIGRATDRYNQGDYIGAIQEVTMKLDQKQSYPMNTTKIQWLDTVHQALRGIEAMPANGLDQKMARLERIYQARLLVGKGFYQNEFVGFNDRYPMSSLKQDIAQLYYEKGTLNTGKTTQDYLYRAQTFERGLSYAEYKDIAALAKKNRFEYSKNRAEEHYQDGLSYLKTKEYQLASEAFKQSQQVYSAYGQYKDAQVLAAKYEKIWRTAAAETQFNTATQLMKNARSKADYREVAAEFAKVKSIYAQYGDYKNTNALYTSTYQKGRIYVAYSIDKVKGIDSCGSFRDDDISTHLINALNKQFSTYPYSLSTSKHNADFVIDIEYRNETETSRLDKNTKAQSWVSKEGKEYKFNQQTEHQSNSFTMRIDIDTRGSISSRDQVKLSSSSAYEQIKYTGDVPSGFKNSHSGELLKERALCKETFDDLDRKVKNVFYDIERKARRL